MTSRDPLPFGDIKITARMTVDTYCWIFPFRFSNLHVESHVIKSKQNSLIAGDSYLCWFLQEVWADTKARKSGFPEDSSPVEVSVTLLAALWFVVFHRKSQISKCLPRS